MRDPNVRCSTRSRSIRSSSAGKNGLLRLALKTSAIIATTDDAELREVAGAAREL
jgi:hypothetical protein